MYICRITYRSEEFRVRAYLAFPSPCRMIRKHVKSWLTDIYGEPMQVDDIALPIKYDSDPPSTSTPSFTYPALVYCRGGIGNVGRVRPEWIAEFAQQGYVVIAPCYRGSEGGEGRDEFGGAEQADVEYAIQLMMSHPMVSERHISLLGFSRGSINAAQAATHFPFTHSLILFGGVCDLAATYAERIDLRRMLKRVLGGTPTRVPEKYTNRSPIHLLPSIRCPILLVHGVKDVQVAFHHSTWLSQAMEMRQHNYDFIIIPNQGHHLPPLQYSTVVEKICRWITSVK